MSLEKPLQLRLGFSDNDNPLDIHLTLKGLTLDVSTTDPAAANNYLKLAGADPTLTNQSLTFPAIYITALAHLPEQVTLTCAPTLQPILDYLATPTTTAELTLENTTLVLSWHDGIRDRSEPIATSLAPLLLTANFPFVATPSALNALQKATSLPLLLGRGHVNEDGYIEIETSKPQLVENTNLPALFRLDDTHFGLPLPFHQHFTKTRGFSWNGGPPQLETPPPIPALPMPLSRHATNDLHAFTKNLAAYRAQAVVWKTGLGRRIFTLAAIETLDAWPALIVTTPATIWAWTQHLALYGRTTSLSHDEADTQIITYQDLATKRHPTSPHTIIFDDLGNPQTLTPRTLTALRRLDVATDAYRIAISSTWPETPQEILNVMSVLRPGEFNPATHLEMRYPKDARAAFTTHVKAYLATRTDPTNPQEKFPTANVRQLTPTEEQTTAYQNALQRHGHTSPQALLHEALEITSAGPNYALSPKIATAVNLTTEALQNNQQTVILTKTARTVTLLRTLLRHHNPIITEATPPPPNTALTIIRYDREIPQIKKADNIIVVDIPWSWALLDQAIGSPLTTNRPKNITVLHLTNTIDDNLALLASRRQQLGPVLDQTAPPDGSETNFLLEDLRQI